ncbi:MAG: hypothetical protein R3272_14100 [Candidatus Promineifilaceae bacterium]|nr:hypothetical protein [Candidatus Promineifilaceae bacterium]
MHDFIWQRKPWQAFKNIAIIFSFTMNFFFLIVLLLAAPLVLPIVDSVARPLVGGLSASFVEMGDATIIRNIEVRDEIPVSFTLPLSTTTSVVIQDPVPLTVPATMVLPGGGGQINGQVQLSLPAGMVLPIALDLDVPVENTIPIALDVAVNIPLEETELGAPFSTLEALFTPLDSFLYQLPQSNEDLMRRLETEISGEAALDGATVR